MRYLPFVVLPLFFTGCTTPNHTLTKEQLSLNTQTLHYNKKFENQTVVYPYARCTQNTIAIKTNTLFIEKIATKPKCQWSGSALGFYKDFLNNTFQNLKEIDIYKKDTIEIYKYATEEKLFYFISYYDASGDIFVLDYIGDMTASLSEGKFPLIKKENQVKTKLDKGLLSSSVLGSYFQSTKDNAQDTTLPIILNK